MVSLPNMCVKSDTLCNRKYACISNPDNIKKLADKTTEIWKTSDYRDAIHDDKK